MNKLILFFTASLLFSCQKICDVASVLCKSNTEKKEFIDFTQIDRFPQFKNCDTLLDYKESKNCFELTMSSKINNRVQNLQFNSDIPLKENISIHFSINNKGVFIFNKLKTNDSLFSVLPNLETKIQEVFNGLPAVLPAQKRGIPVQTNYTLPLFIKTN